MPRFYYIARDKSGKKITDYEEASTPEEVVSRLQAKDLIVINVLTAEHREDLTDLRAAIGSKVKPKSLHYRVTGDDLVLFCRQLATLLGAGVTILKSLDIISQQISSRKLLNIPLCISFKPIIPSNKHHIHFSIRIP